MSIGQASVSQRKKTKAGFHMASSMKPPREMLLDLINRSGLSQTDVAQLLGFSHTSGFNRYLRAPTQGDRPIAINIVKKLVPILAGRGHPSITAEEVMALTTLTGGRATEDGPKMLSSQLELRYRVEKGTYVKLGDQQGIGPAPICAAADFAFYGQFAVVHGREYLHCVDKTQFSPQALMGKRAVVAVPFEKTGLHEVVVERIGESMSGKVLGVVIGRYERE